MQKASNGIDKIPIGMTMAKWEDINGKALNGIQLCLSNEVLREVVK